MFKIPIDMVKKDMLLAKSIYTDSGVLLVHKDSSLTDNIIRKLKEINIDSVLIKTALEDFQVDDGSILDEEISVNMVKTMRDIFKNVNKSVKIDEKDLKELVNIAIEDILTKQEVVISLGDVRSHDSYTYVHSVNVCILSLVTGRNMGMDRKNLSQLGVGALLHDLGKIRVPCSILSKPGKLTDEEFDIIKEHPFHGAYLAEHKYNVNKTSIYAISEHHERYDGSGYPRNLKEKKIHIYGRITGLADVFDALTADRVYRPGYLPHEAYEMIAGSGDTAFDFNVVKAFLENVAVYNIGSFLQLNTGQIGMVVKNVKGLTHRPVLKMIFNDKGKKLITFFEFDLSKSINSCITKVLKNDEIKELLEMNDMKELF